jgi:lipopolysaccharide/colanic/teichoic acid biosynthesis glycosyltransferase
MKRPFDIVTALSGLIIFSPILLVVALMIIISMGWPVFFRQIRVGKGGGHFKIIKFRSMLKNADQSGPDLTIKDDARITPLGRLLRKSKIDELPQLINVLKGEMSIVGPRPEVPRFVRLYNEEQRNVLCVRPGLTDPASIVYRDEEKVLARFDDTEKAYIEKIMPAKLKLNLAYIKKATFWTDLGIILKTGSKLFH